MSDRQPWLLLIHQLPPKPDYFRVKIGRRLARIGAVPIKNSVYVLPVTDQALEDFQWLIREITDGGGEASVCQSVFVEGPTDADIERLFKEARARDYEEVAGDARAVLKRLRPTVPLSDDQRAAAEDMLSKLQKRFAVVESIDFFGPDSRETTRELIHTIADGLRQSLTRQEMATSPAARQASTIRGRTWVTRQGIFVDRIASAWLIRRFIDPEAQFKFVAPQGYKPKPGELRFDMFEAEYTHEGDRCTFETLLRRFELEDPALADIAEVVHDIDLKDVKFGREDTAGIERVLAGIATAHPEDSARLARGAQLFDELYAVLRKNHDVEKAVT